MIHTLGYYKYKGIFVYKMFDTVVWYDVYIGDEIYHFRNVDQAQEFIDKEIQKVS